MVVDPMQRVERGYLKLVEYDNVQDEGGGEGDEYRQPVVALTPGQHTHPGDSLRRRVGCGVPPVNGVRFGGRLEEHPAREEQAQDEVRHVEQPRARVRRVDAGASVVAGGRR
eukprot:5341354-Prymnesium_polylepis.1